MSNHRASRILAGVVLAASLFFARAQQAVAPPALASASANSADVMQIYLVAHDKKDKPVLDLKPDDLTITDDGTPVKLDHLRLADQHHDPKQVVSFVFDSFPPELDGQPPTNSSRINTARDAAMKILSMIAESGFEFSVFNIDSRLRLQQNFTSDVSSVQTAIMKATGPSASRDKDHAAASEKEVVSVAFSGSDSTGKRVSARERLMAQSIYAAIQNSTRIAQDRHFKMSLSSVLALVQAQHDLPGRKTIIYLSSVHQEQIDAAAKEAIDSIVGSANQAGVGINVVDGAALGHHGSQVKLLNAGSEGIAHSLSLINWGSGEGTLDVVDDAPIDTDLKHLAEATGGTYLNGDGSKAMRQLVGDMTTYYQASFLLKNDDYDGKLHPLLVNPLRAGLRIRTQAGYLALPPPSADGSRVQPFELPLMKLLNQSPLPSQFPLRASVLDMGDSDEGRRTAFAIEIPIDGLGVQKDTNSAVSLAHLTVIANVKDQTGAVATHFSSDTPQRVASRHPGDKNVPVISVQRHFTLSPGKYTLEVLAVDTTTRKAAAQRIPFEVAGPSGSPSLSNMILVRRTDPVPPNEGDTGDPLRDYKNHVTPNLSGSLPTGDNVVSIFFVVHDNPSAPKPATLEIKVLRDGELVGGAPLVTRQASGAEYFSYLGSFSLIPITDGKYQVEALLTQGGKTAESDTFFTLSGAEGAGSAALSNLPALESVSRPAGPLAISVSANPIQRPPDDEIKTLLTDAAQSANDYWDALPNFTCLQVTERFTGSNNAASWEHIDTLTGQLNYFDHQEDWEFLEYEKDHKISRDSSSNPGRGVFEAGIFGGVIRGLFRLTAKANISWLETDALGDGTVQVFKYSVAKDNSNLNLRASATQVVRVGYHGMIYIDSATHGVRRITEVADGVPKNYPIHEALVSADYDYVSIGGQQYLLPIGAQTILRQGSAKSKLELDQLHFRDFHRFVSTTKILGSTPIPEP